MASNSDFEQRPRGVILCGSRALSGCEARRSSQFESPGSCEASLSGIFERSGGSNRTRAAFPSAQATPKHARVAYSEWPSSSKASLSGNFEDRGDSEGGSDATFECSGLGRINKTSPRHGELALYIYLPKNLKTLGRHFGPGPGLGPWAGPTAPMRIDYANLSLSLSLYIYT